MDQTIEEFRNLLRQFRIEIKSEGSISNDTGYEFRLAAGPVAKFYHTGTRQKQGKRWDQMPDEVSAFMDGRRSQAGPNRSVFVVYGHDLEARRELERLLLKWGLKPLILDQLPSGGKTIIEKLEAYRGEACYAVVLATPDDQGHPAGDESKKFFRARQNVILELGMMLAVLGREKVAILLKDGVNMERPSDIQGLLYIPFRQSVDEVKVTLAQELHEQGIRIDLANL